MLARDKGNFHALDQNRTRDPPVQGLERAINMQYSDFIFLFIIRVFFFMIRVDPSPILFYFNFFYSIRVGPSRSELIRPGLAVRVDPVRLLYLPLEYSIIHFNITIIFTSTSKLCGRFALTWIRPRLLRPHLFKSIRPMTKNTLQHRLLKMLFALIILPSLPK